ncbi:MAG: Protease HtpX [Candidatus Heimdallarchaeota archaeon LC_3]|nr:MAG: Protease HtpX [Candidatus Heimdallarchaeota archaeon LC_3]
MEMIGLIDLLFIIIPFFLVNLVLILFSTSHFPLKSKIPLIIVSYSLLITSLIFSVVLIFHLHFGESFLIHIHELHSPTIFNFFMVRIDSLGVLILLWSISVSISAFILSQIAILLLKKTYERKSISQDVLNARIKSEFSESTNKLITQYNIKFFLINNQNPILFSFSHFFIKRRHNNILISNSFLELCDVDELEVGILHEIAHIKYRDTIFKPILNAISKLMFFDLVLKKTKKKYEEKVELRADNFVIELNKNYKLLAKLLIKIEENNSNQMKKDFIIKFDEKSKSPSDFSKSLLKNRIQNILSS